MKKQLKSLLLVAIFACTTLPAWSQASTEGREFWVALNMTTGTGGTVHSPFICITTQYQGGSYTITNPADASFAPITGLIPPTGYIKITASTTPGPGQIDLNKWYPVGQTAPSMSCQLRNVGLKVTTTVESSVFVGNRLPQSFDAANILPITALQTEYITQDYPGYDHGGTSLNDGGFPVITILATENNTHVTILPSSNVLNSTGTSIINKTLNAGQVLYLTGDNRATLSGTSVTSDKKIAVFTGVNNTDVPGPVSARDHLYEQNMPTDYWGTHFVVTRSMKKDANRIRVTASNNGTEIIVDGMSLATINAGDTYEFELCEEVMRTEDGYTKAVGVGRGTEFYLDGEAHYLETTCPCAVYSYDVSENYYVKKNGTSERDPNSAGDPAMVWISPLEQQLSKVTFGVMNTDQTPTHYVNIITPTEGAASLAVREIKMNGGQVVYGNNLVQPTDVKPVPANPAYSYARIKLMDNAESVYTITSDIGFIAHVYGSGNKESYAYSCGSAAVQQGVKVNGMTFTNGYRSDSKFCFGDVIDFDANVGTDEITRVDWYFGDGTTEYYGQAQTQHTYTSPGWYDVTADLYGHQVCTNEDEMFLGQVTFSFLVYRPDTTIGSVRPTDCVSLEEYKSNPTYWDEKILHGDIDTVQENCYDDVVLDFVTYAAEKEDIRPDLVGQDLVQGYNGKWYDVSTDVIDTIPDPYSGCNIYRKYHVEVITCLNLEVLNAPAMQTVCPGEAFNISYTKHKGNIDGDATFRVPGYPDQTIILDDNVTNGSFTVPVGDITKPGYYSGELLVNDLYCPDRNPLKYTIDFTVYYPEDIFKYKYNNVLAVYKPGQGGNEGYEFTAYQWFRNGAPIEGATSSILYLGQGVTFESGDIVYVMLTDKDGMVLPSCSQVIEDVKDFNPEPQNAPAYKELINRSIVIQKGEHSYNIYGQRIQ